MIRRILCAVLLALLPTVAVAQVKPSGQFTPGHALRALNSQGTAAGDAGGAAGSRTFNSGYLTEIGITNTGLPFCINDALTSGGYHRFCIGANALGGGLISFDAVAGAAALPLQCKVNGVLSPCFGGNVTGFPVAPNNTALKAATGPTVLRAGFAVQGDGGDALYNLSSSPCSLNAGAGDNGLQVKPNSGTGCWIAAFPNGVAAAQVWGADGTNTADSSPALNAAMVAQATGGSNFCVLIPTGNYKLLSVVDIASDSACLQGAGMANTHLYINSTTASAIHVSALQFVKITGGMTIDRVGTATAGAAGIAVDPGGNWTTIDKVYSTNHWYGFSLGATTGISWVTNSVAQNNLSDGFFSTNAGGAVNNQWQYGGDLSQGNAGYGYHEVTAAALGPGTGSSFYNGTAAFANTLGGLAVIGQAGSPISDVFIRNVIASTDGGPEIQVSPFGGTNIVIDGAFLELAGQQATGPTLSTPASHLGQGILIGGTASGGVVQASGITCLSNSEECLKVSPQMGSIQVSNLSSTSDNASVSGSAINIVNANTNAFLSNAVVVAGTHGTYGISSAGLVQQANVTYFGGSSGGCHFTGLSPQSVNTTGTGCGTVPTVYFPTPACSTGSLPTITSTSSAYIRNGNQVEVLMSFQTSTSGCAGGSFDIPLPFDIAANISAPCVGVNQASGSPVSLGVFGNGGGNFVAVGKYDGTSATTAAASLNVRCTYFTTGG